MVATTSAALSSPLYPPNWPDVPFHDAEVQIQKRLGVHELVMSYGPKFIRPFMPDQHREFYANLPFLVVAARDEQDRMWSTLLFGEEKGSGFISSPSPIHLDIRAKPLPGDALEGSLGIGSHVGILGIEFATRRRNRVNGQVVVNNSESGIQFRVGQSYGNCPQYIKPREWWTATHDSEVCIVPSNSSRRSNRLSQEQIDQIQSAESVFLATGILGDMKDPRVGNDSSHRGGEAGFLQVVGDENTPDTILIPDYSGNNIYNTIGNIESDPRIGMAIPLYETGGLIQITGTAKINWDSDAAAEQFVGAARVIEFSVDEIVDLAAGSLPIRWSTDAIPRIEVEVKEKVQESSDVTSFHFVPVSGNAPSLPAFKPGQHLPITVPASNSHDVERTYSLSGDPDDKSQYRISVKRDPNGLVSRYLHDKVQVGDVIQVQKPAGYFVLNLDPISDERRLVLLSNGIGVTPMMSMLHAVVNNQLNSKRRVVWVHGARNGTHHLFKKEVRDLEKLSNGRISKHIVYSQPHEDDEFDFRGRIDIHMLKKIIPDIIKADIYVCGSDAFTADMSSSLEQIGATNVYHESF